jgi:hypothetical protein
MVTAPADALGPWRLHTLLDAWSLVSDTIWMDTSPFTAPLAGGDGGQPLVLAALQAALSSPEAATGTHLNPGIHTSCQGCDSLKSCA